MDQKLAHWLKIDLGHIQFVKICDIKTQELHSPVAAFNNNFWQALHLSTFPIGIFDLGERFSLAYLAACQQRLEDFCLADFRPLSNEECEDIRQLSRDIMGGKARPRIGFWQSPIFAEDLISFVSPKTIETYNTLMNSQLVLCWTAFETLAGDLWEAAINTHCLSLVSRAWKSKSVSFEALRDNGFNLTNKMGTILRAHLENPFQSLKSMRKTYQDVFDQGWASEDRFWNDPNISSTFHIRNLIVHRASVVDDKFRKDCESDARITLPPRGERFYLDGKLITELTTGLFDAGKRLIQSVDGCISRNT